MGRVRDNRGALLLEALISVFLLVYTLSAMPSLWNSSEKWFRAVRERANLLREARIARDVLMGSLLLSTNMSGTVSLTVVQPGKSPVFSKNADDQLEYEWDTTRVVVANHLSAINVTEFTTNQHAKAELDFVQGTRTAQLRLWVTRP